MLQRAHLSTPPNVYHLEYVGEAQNAGRIKPGETFASVVLGCSSGHTHRTMEFSAWSWSAEQPSPACILLYRTRPDDADHDYPNTNTDYYLLTKTA